MAIEYPVKIKFNYDSSQIKRVQKDVNAQVGKADKERGGRSQRGAGTRAGILGGIGAGEMMEGKGGKGGGKGGASGGLKTLGKIAGTLGIIAGLLKVFQPFIETIFNLLQYFVFKFLDWLPGFSFGKKGKKDPDIPDYGIYDPDQMKQNKEALNKLGRDISDLWNSFGKWLSNIWNGFTEWLGEFWGSLKGVDDWVWNNIIKPAWIGLQDMGQYVWNIIKSAFMFLANVGVWIWNRILRPAFMWLINVGKWIWNKILFPAFNWLINVGKWIWNKIIAPAFDYLADVGKWIWKRIIKPAFDYLSDIGNKIWNLVINAFDGLKGIGSAIWGWIKDMVDKLNPFGDNDDNDKPEKKDVSDKGGGGSGFFSNREGIQGLLNTRPGKAFGGKATSDGLYKLHAGEQVSRGNTTSTGNSSPTINVNIIGSSSVDDDTINEISRRITDELRSFERF